MLLPSVTHYRGLQPNHIQAYVATQDPAWSNIRAL
jgi:hypothetical protein